MNENSHTAASPVSRGAADGITLKLDKSTIAPEESLSLSVTGETEETGPFLLIWNAGNEGGFVPFSNQCAVVSCQLMDTTVAASLQNELSFKAVWETGGVPAGTHQIHVIAFAHKPRMKLTNLTELVSSANTKKYMLENWIDSLSEKWKYIGGDMRPVEVTKPPKGPMPPNEPITVTMRRAAVDPTADQALWTVIRNSTNALSFNNYDTFMRRFLCGEDEKRPIGRDFLDIKSRRDPIKHRLRLPFPDVDAYRQLKVATEVFMMANTGVFLQDLVKGLRDDQVDEDQEGRRYYRKVRAAEITGEWNKYLGKPQMLPYFDIILQKLKNVTAVSQADLNRGDLKKDRKGETFLQGEEDAITCLNILMEKLTNPCLLELIWSYWHEEGMLVQTMNAITWRFQNRRGPADRDPLAALEIDPLRPLNNFIWGYIQDEQHRLTVPRRAYEYDHHYGLTLLGKAVPAVRGADSRARFLEGFHHLLHVCSIFFKEDDDTTVVADGFPVLNALKEVHLLLTQGAHNQYLDLPWTARQEMLMQEWLLARPEMREFLPSRIMVDFEEPWMDRVETMKTLQGWTDTSIMHFRDLGVFGEKILLGIRFGTWPSIIEPQQAANWARYWRPEIQGYIHAYRAVTGVDLTERVDATLPALLLKRRLAPQRAAGLPHVVAAPFPSRLPR